MSYVIYPLHFRTAVRFGVPGRGGRLDEACMEYPADALFGALCAELAAAGEEESLVRLAEESSAATCASPTSCRGRAAKATA